MEKITTRQFNAIIILSIMSVSALGVPGAAAYFASDGGWISVLIAGLISVIYILLALKLAGMFPGLEFAEYSRRIIGEIPGFFICLALAFKFIFSSAMELRLFGELIGDCFLYNTPAWAIAAIFLLPCIYLCSKEFDVMARLSQMMILIVMAILLVLLVTSFTKPDFRELIPERTDLPSVVYGAVNMSFLFRAATFALFILPFSKGVDKKGILAVVIPGILLFSFCISIFVKFGQSYTMAQIFPIMRLTDNCKPPFQRQDAFMLCAMFITTLIAVSAGLYFASSLMRRIFFAKDKRIIMPLAFLGVYIIALIPINAGDAFGMIYAADGVLSLLYLFFVPLILIVIAKIRRLK